MRTDRRFDVAAVRIVGIAGQAAAGFHRLGATGEDRHAVPAFLPVPDRAVAGGRIAAAGNLSSGAFSSWRQTISGAASCSHLLRLAAAR